MEYHQLVKWQLRLGAPVLCDVLPSGFALGKDMIDIMRLGKAGVECIVVQAPQSLAKLVNN